MTELIGFSKISRRRRESFAHTIHNPLVYTDWTSASGLEVSVGNTIVVEAVD